MSASKPKRNHPWGYTANAKPATKVAPPKKPSTGGKKKA